MALAMASDQERDRRTWTDLHVAADRGHHEMVKDLLRAGEDVNIRSGILHLTPLMVACRSESVTTAEILLSHPGCDVNAQNVSGRCALHEAVNKGSILLCKLLLGNRARVDIVTDDGNTPLHLAAQRGHLMVTQLLLAMGHCDIQFKDKEGRTPAYLANISGHYDVWSYLQEGMVYPVVTEGWMVLKSAPDLHLAASFGSTTLVLLLLGRGDDVNSRDRSGATPLLVAAKAGSVMVCHLLIENGAKPSASDYRGMTALHEAALLGQADICKLLLYSDANVGARTNGSITPLHYAAGMGRLEVVKLLLEDGADPEAKDNRGLTPLQYAITNSEETVRKLLLLEISRSSHRIMIARPQGGGTPSYPKKELQQSIFEKDFQFIVLLGKGSFGEVCKAKKRMTGTCFAVKRIVLPSNEQMQTRIFREIKILERLSKQQRNIIQYYHAWTEKVSSHQEWPGTGQGSSTSRWYTATKSSLRSLNVPSTFDYLYITLELCHKDTLSDRLKAGRLGLKTDKLLIMEQISCGVEYIHKQEIMHRDLKPQNIFFSEDENVAKIGDFGLSKVCDPSDEPHVSNDQTDPAQSGKLGTELYWSPEQQNGDFKNISYPSDIYSLGITFFQTLTPHVQEEKQLLSLLYKDIRRHKFPPDFVRRNEKEATLLKWMLAKVPGDRPKASQVRLEVLECIDHLNKLGSDMLKASGDGDTSMVTDLLEKGVGVNLKRKSGDTALHEACFGGHLTTVQLLVDRGVDVNLTGGHQLTPLHYASLYGHFGVVTHLLSVGADLHCRGYRQWTPLHFASAFAHKFVASYLISEGADCNLKDKYEHTPMDLARISGRDDFAIGLQELDMSRKRWTKQ